MGLKYRSGPGLLDFELSASMVQGRYHLEQRIIALDCILKEYEDYTVTCCAVLNLQGTLLYYQDRYLDALRTFEKVLTKDEQNLNAKTNIKLLQQQLGLLKSTEKDCSQSALQKATYLGEQGFAIMFDCYVKEELYDRFHRAKSLFDECLDSLEEDVDPVVVSQWKLWYVALYQRLITNCKPGPIKQQHINDANETLKAIFNSPVFDNDGHKLLKSMAWTWTGVFKALNKDDDKDVMECFEKAKGIKPNTESLVRYALYLRRRGDEDSLQKAKTVMDSNIKNQGDDCNWFGYAVRSSVYLKLCQLLWGKMKTGETLSEEFDEYLSWLQQVIDDGERAAKLNPTSELFTNIGSAYHLQAKYYRERSPGTDQQDLYFRALANFLHATRHLDGKKYSYIHEKHGDCLRDMAQYRSAIESFKRSLECQGGEGRKKKYRKLMECFMDLLLEDQSDYDLIQEILHWLDIKGSVETSSDGQLTEKSQNDSTRTDVLNGLLCYKDGVAMEIVIRQMLIHGYSDILEDLLKCEEMQKRPKVVIECLLTLFPKQDTMPDTMHPCLNCLRSCELKDCDLEPYSEQLVKLMIETRKSTCCMETVEDHPFLKTVGDLYDHCPQVVIYIVKLLLGTCENKSLGLVILDSVVNSVQATGNHDSHYQACVHDMLFEEHHITAVDSKPCEETPVADKWTSELLLDIMPNCPSDHIVELKRRFTHYAMSAVGRPVEKAPDHCTPPKDPRTRQTQYEYDFYVLHSESDRDRKWVCHELVPTLEKRYGFKGCIELRDFQPGSSILDENDKKIKQSKKIVVVLTDDFNNSGKCRFFLHQAVHGKFGQWGIIPIRRDHSDIPDEMKMFVSLKAVHNTDWEKLVKSLINGDSD